MRDPHSKVLEWSTLSRGRPLILRHMLGSGGLNFLDIVMYLHLLWLNKSTFLSDHAWS